MEGTTEKAKKCIHNEREYGDVIGQHPALVRRAPILVKPLPSPTRRRRGESSEATEVVAKGEWGEGARHNRRKHLLTGFEVVHVTSTHPSVWRPTDTAECAAKQAGTTKKGEEGRGGT